MWNHEHRIETDTSPASIWAQYADVSTWPGWNPGTGSVDLEGTFRTGARGVLTSLEYGPTPFTLVEVIEHEGFTMETQVDAHVVLRSSCRVTALPGDGSRIVHRSELSGQGSEQLGSAIGPAIAKNLAEGAQALVAASGAAA
ncbi:SRPBCC family protein [Streptomyces sp. NPDC048484]|uniref:SRPBCC family protein n=1 Tax=Streptomyces sp. NPDC048484 TaxID=3155146 RepID=UPI0034287434